MGVTTVSTMVFLSRVADTLLLLAAVTAVALTPVADVLAGTADSTETTEGTAAAGVAEGEGESLTPAGAASKRPFRSATAIRSATMCRPFRVPEMRTFLSANPPFTAWAPETTVPAPTSATKPSIVTLALDA